MNLSETSTPAASVATPASDELAEFGLPAAAVHIEKAIAAMAEVSGSWEVTIRSGDPEQDWGFRHVAAPAEDPLDPPSPAGLDLSEIIDGSGGLYSSACNLANQIFILLCRLEDAFDFGRAAEKTPDGGLKLFFQKSGIDADLWLVGCAWNEALDLKTKIEAIQASLDEQTDGGHA